MKKLLLSFITATLLSSMSAGSAGAQELPEQKETLATIIKSKRLLYEKVCRLYPTLVFLAEFAPAISGLAEYIMKG